MFSSVVIIFYVFYNYFPVLISPLCSFLFLKSEAVLLHISVAVLINFTSLYNFIYFTIICVTLKLQLY